MKIHDTAKDERLVHILALIMTNFDGAEKGRKGQDVTDYKSIQGTTEDELRVYISSDNEIGVASINTRHPELSSACYIRPQEARELAAHLIQLADEIESKA